ncbi:MAG: hypothetical protein ACI86H_002103 [bacterium]|jgi:hypothetical protein
MNNQTYETKAYIIQEDTFRQGIINTDDESSWLKEYGPITTSFIESLIFRLLKKSVMEKLILSLDLEKSITVHALCKLGSPFNHLSHDSQLIVRFYDSEIMFQIRSRAEYVSEKTVSYYYLNSLDRHDQIGSLLDHNFQQLVLS